MTAKRKVSIAELFQDERAHGGYVNISAPMVRYSKMEFRALMRKYNVKLCYTPMVIADSFCKSGEARRNEFTTNQNDTPVIAQFAARNSIDFLSAAEMVYPYVDGVDLNCGCPQKWAISDGYGCALLKQPNLLHDMIKTIKRNFPDSFSVSVKLRILDKSLPSTVNLCRQLEKCGVTFLAIHGRRPWQKSSEPVDVAGLAEIRKSLCVPLVVNGNVKCVKDANELHAATNCDGVMAARGLLTNPALFSGYSCTPKECVQDWVDLAYAAGDRITFQCFHHHLTFMTEKLISKRLRVKFNNFTNKSEIYQFLEEVLQINASTDVTQSDSFLCAYDEMLYKNRTNAQEANREQYTVGGMRNGKFFEEFRNSDDPTDPADDSGQLDFMGISIFDL